MNLLQCVKETLGESPVYCRDGMESMADGAITAKYLRLVTLYRDYFIG
jgi:hypothetical protein